MWRMIIGQMAYTSIRTSNIELFHYQTCNPNHNCPDDRYTMKPRLQFMFDVVVLLVKRYDREVIETYRTVVEWWHPDTNRKNECLSSARSHISMRRWHDILHLFRHWRKSWMPKQMMPSNHRHRVRRLIDDMSMRGLCGILICVIWLLPIRWQRWMQTQNIWCFRPFDNLATQQVHRTGGMLESQMCLRYCLTYCGLGICNMFLSFNLANWNFQQESKNGKRIQSSCDCWLMIVDCFNCYNTVVHDECCVLCLQHCILHLGTM